MHASINFIAPLRIFWFGDFLLLWFLCLMKICGWCHTMCIRIHSFLLFFLHIFAGVTVVAIIFIFGSFFAIYSLFFPCQFCFALFRRWDFSFVWFQCLSANLIRKTSRRKPTAWMHFERAAEWKRHQAILFLTLNRKTKHLGSYWFVLLVRQVKSPARRRIHFFYSQYREGIFFSFQSQHAFYRDKISSRCKT